MGTGCPAVGPADAVTGCPRNGMRFSPTQAFLSDGDRGMRWRPSWVIPSTRSMSTRGMAATRAGGGCVLAVNGLANAGSLQLRQEAHTSSSRRSKWGPATASCQALTLRVAGGTGRHAVSCSWPRRSGSQSEPRAYQCLTVPDVDPHRGVDRTGQHLAELVGPRGRQSSVPDAAAGRRPGRTDGAIAVGKRREALLSAAGRLRAQGVPKAEAAATLEGVWARCAQPESDPLPWREAQALLDDVYTRYPVEKAAAQSASSAAASAPTATSTPERVCSSRLWPLQSTPTQGRSRSGLATPYGCTATASTSTTVERRFAAVP